MVKAKQFCALIASLGLLCDLACAEERAASTGPLTASGIGQWFLSMFAVLAIIFVLAYFLKRSRLVQHKSGQMNIVGQLALGPKERLVQVNIDGRDILVGVGQANVSYICDLNPQDNTFASKLNGALNSQDLQTVIIEAVNKAVDAKLVNLKAEIKDAVSAQIGLEVFKSLNNLAKQGSSDELKLEQDSYAKAQEQKEDEAIAHMKADESRENYDLSPVPGAKSYTIVDPHEKKDKKAKPYEFKPLPSEKDLKVQKEIPYDELLPSQDFRTVNKELMQQLEIETAPKPEDYTDEEGNPIPRPRYSSVPFKRHIIGNGFAGRGFIG